MEFPILSYLINDWRKRLIFKQCIFCFTCSRRWSNILSISHTDLWPSVLAGSSSASAPRSLPGPESTQSPGPHGCPLHPSHSRLPAYDSFSQRPLAVAARGPTASFSPAPSEMKPEQVCLKPQDTLNTSIYWPDSKIVAGCPLMVVVEQCDCIYRSSYPPEA